MMLVDIGRNLVLRRGVGPVFCAAVFLAGAGAAVLAQAPNPSSAANPYFGSVTAQPLSNEPLKLSLDDAVRRGFENNLGLKWLRTAKRRSTGKETKRCRSFCPLLRLRAAPASSSTILRRRALGRACSPSSARCFPAGSCRRGFR